MNRLEGLFTTRSPLSHIGKSVSIGSVLNTRPMLQENGRLVNVFCYNANAWRGQMRRLCAVHLAKSISLINDSSFNNAISFDEIVQHIPTEKFTFLMTGGVIGGQSKFDLAAVRNHFELMPHFALFGGCLNNQMLPGRFAPLDILPLCKEALCELPPSLHEVAKNRSIKDMIIQRPFSRKDETKNSLLNAMLDAEEYAKVSKKSKDSDDGAVQMRMSSQLLNSGVELFSRVSFNGVNKLEFGAFCAGLSMFAKFPFIGGQHNKGHGKVDLVYSIGSEHFFSVLDFDVTTSALFDECLAAYDAHLAANKTEIVALLS
jgi:hypothetical protein